jgi:molybdate transport system regulatory protein
VDVLELLNKNLSRKDSEEHMDSRKTDSKTQGRPDQPLTPSKSLNHGRIVSMPDETQCLDTVKLNRLEQSFREWVEDSLRTDVRLSRRRILIIFLLIRYTGAKLNEVLALNPFNDIDSDRQLVFFRSAINSVESSPREVQISEALSREIQSALADPAFKNSLRKMFDVDPGFVRRKFYERAEACGFSKRLGGPEMIRKARAVELMQGNMPLPAVQIFLGHSTPNLTRSYVSFSDDEIREVTKFFIERESSRKTSARNSFFGKIQVIQRGDIQARIELTTIGGYSVITVITNDSLERLGLKEGKLITAEVKAPWVILQKRNEEPECTAENRFNGVIERVNKGEINTEYAVRISDGTVLCSVVTTESSRSLNLKEGDGVWALFNCFSVVLHVD